MEQWYEKDDYYKKRLIREVEIIKGYKTELPESNFFYEFTGELKSFSVGYIYEYRGKAYGIFCMYPMLYPKTRIKVTVLEYDPKQEKIIPFDEGYHNTNGVLCLLGHYPNQWKEEYGIEYVIQRVKEWFEDGQYDKNNIVPIHNNADEELFIFPDSIAVRDDCDYGIFEFYTVREKICVATSTKSLTLSKNVDFIPKSLNSDGRSYGKGVIIFTLKQMENKIPTDYSDIKSIMNCFKRGKNGFLNYATHNNIPFPIPLVVIYKNFNFNGQAFFIDGDDKKLTLKFCRFEHLRVYEDIFSRIKDKENLDYLRRKKVALVGLGAIGSVVATELARSGIADFVLVDYDKLEIKNIGRHDLTLKDIDKYKTEAVEEKILDINPKAQCVSYSGNVLDDASFILTRLLKCDLVISTMDDQEAKEAIDSTLVQNGIKTVFAGAFYNAVGGYVLISDKRMGCFQCISRRMDYMAETKEIPDFSSLVPAGIEYNCGTPTFPGGSVNTHTVSLLTARLSIDSLLGTRETNEEGYPYNLYFVGNEKMMVDQRVFFNGYMDLKKYVIPGIAGCKVCDKIGLLSEAENKTYEEILEKIAYDHNK